MPKRAPTYILKPYALIAEKDGREIVRDHVQAYGLDDALTYAYHFSSVHKVDLYDELVSWRAEELTAPRP